MSLTTWPSVLAWARGAVAGVVPDVEPQRKFRLCDGYLALVLEPTPRFDRAFVVEGGEARDGQWYGMQESRDVRKELIVSVGYHAHLSRANLEERMGRDEEQIVSALLRRDGYPAGVTLVEWGDSQVDRGADAIEPDRMILQLRFFFTYRTSF